MRRPKPYIVRRAVTRRDRWWWALRDHPTDGGWASTLAEAMDAAYAHARGERS